ncbi:MAG TPA: hypothetical protein VGF24_14705 [Vicinamibacterales bacterium]|jgi:hypothetical protein
MPQHSSIATLTLFGLLTIACGGNDGGDNGNGGSQSPSLPPTTAQNPCPASSLAFVTESEPGPSQPPKTSGVPNEGDPRGTLGDVLWRHRAAEGRLRPSATTAPRATQDVGEIAVIQDEGDLIAPANTFDLQGTGLRYTPRGSSYDVTRTDGSFRAAIGSALTLGDDDSSSSTVSFTFNFYGRAQSMAFVNSDGNITFGVNDTASTNRSISRVLSGAARVAPFFADLDPSAGGTVFLRSAADAFTVTWCGVRVWDSPRKATFQTSFFPDGSIEMKYAAASSWTAVDGIAAISPGHTTAFMPVDLSTSSRTISGGAGAIGERFSLRPDLDLVALAQKFYRTHRDLYDQLIVWTDDVMTPEDAFSFEVTVANGVTGIGVDTFDHAGAFGSSGRLSSLVQMDAISKFPDDPTARFLGENNTVSVMGQEVGHRWLAFMQFSDHNRQPSDALLGRDLAHWSFFFNSDGSVMEGNRIQDLGGGSFRTVGAVDRYSLLDQYAMGLVRDVDVTPMFYVESPTNVSGNQTPESAPRIGVTFSGTRRDVLINDIIDIMGRRQPSPDASPRVHGQAFLYVVGNGRTAAPAAVAKIDRIRLAWEAFFAQATDGRARVETHLQPGT